MRADGGPEEEDQADPYRVQPHLPHHHRGRRSRQRHQLEALSQSQKDSKGNLTHFSVDSKGYLSQVSLSNLVLTFISMPYLYY